MRQGERKNKKGVLRRDCCHRQLGLSHSGDSQSCHVDQKYRSQGWESRRMYSLSPIFQGLRVAPGKVKLAASGQLRTELERAPRERSEDTGLEMEAVTMHMN